MSAQSSDTKIITDSGMDHEETIKFLGEEEPETIELEKPPKKISEESLKEEEKEEVKVEEEEEIDELEELEKELEGPTEEQLELVTPVRRREILAKYPTLFKDFPYLEKAYYSEQQFTELLPTIEDAKIAVDKAATLDRFETDILSGNTETLLKAVKAENPDGFSKIVDDYLPTLARIDEKAYHHVLGNIIRHTIITMVQEGKRSSNDALQSAAQILNQFVFGSSDFSPPTRLSREEREEDRSRDDKLTKREQEFTRQQFETTRHDLNTRVNNVLISTIDVNIDPKKSMTDYVRRNASREALETLESLINRDTRFKTLLDKLWERAFEENFSKTSTDRIRSACLSRAKTLLPSVIKKARNEALRGLGKRVTEEEEVSENKGPVSVSKPRSEKSGRINKVEDIPKEMRTIDFLMQD